MKKKILFATNHFRFSNGVASVLRSLIQNIDENKYDVYLLPFYEYDPVFAEPIKNKIKLVKGFGFYFRGFDKIIDWIPAKLLYRLFVREKFDIEVSFQYGVPTRCLSASKNPNRICWMHTYDSKMRQRKYYLKYPKMVNVAKIGMQKLIRDGFPPEKCDYCYNIIDESVIIDKSKEELEYRKIHRYAVVTVARMDHDKAYYRYCQCIKKYLDKKETNKDVEFWFLGDGSEREKVVQFVSCNGLENNIKVFGRQDNPYKYLANADLYFCASYREGFSTSAQEAAILGIPVMSVDVDGAQELMELSGVGKVIKNDENAIISELTAVLNNETLLNEWKTNAWKNKERFYKKSRIERVEQILDSASNMFRS